jgi:hypothetical protein
LSRFSHSTLYWGDTQADEVMVYVYFPGAISNVFLPWLVAEKK